MWTRVIAQVGQAKALVGADIDPATLDASVIEWSEALPLNTVVVTVDRYSVERSYYAVGSQACAGVWHIALGKTGLALVAHDKDGVPLDPQVSYPAPPPAIAPVALDAPPPEPDEVIE